MIPYGRQHIDESDLAAVQEVLTSNWLTQGPQVPAFEQAVADYCGVSYAVAVNSATSALHIACLALGVGPGDRVWTSPNSFVASANCALYCGASVDFVDIELQTGNMSVSCLAEKLQAAAKQNLLPKVVIPVHFAGQPCDMHQIAALAQQYGFKVIEDASHAIGARYQDHAVGGCHYSDICVFSFHPVKIITSGEGGMATTQSAKLARAMQMLRSHGITSEPAELTEPSHGVWYYQQHLLGFNYRLTDIQAALGRSQMGKLEQFVTGRQQLAAFYDQALQKLAGVAPLSQQAAGKSSYHLYVVRLTELSHSQHQSCVSYLRQHNVVGHVHYIPIYLQPYYQQLGFRAGYCPQAELYYQQAVTLPLFPDLTAAQLQYVIQTLSTFLQEQA